MGDFKWWCLFNSVIFFFTCVAALAKLIPKRAGRSCFGCISSGHFVHACLILYCSARSATQLAFFLGVAPTRPDLGFMLLNAIPGTFFQFLQTAMIAKWVAHANDIHRLLGKEPLLFVSTFVWVSLSFAVAAAMLSAFVFVYAETSNADGAWLSALLSAVGGTIFMLNGIVFIGLGRLLLGLSSAEGGEDVVSVTRRIVFMSVVFGGTCVARGVVLCVLATERQAVTSATTSWGAPLVLTVEWLALVTSIFLPASGVANCGAARLVSPSRKSWQGSLRTGRTQSQQQFLPSTQVEDSSSLLAISEGS